MATEAFYQRLADLEELDGRPLIDIITEIRSNLDASREADPYGIGDFTIPTRVLRRMVEEIEREHKERHQ